MPYEKNTFRKTKEAPRQRQTATANKRDDDHDVCTVFLRSRVTRTCHTLFYKIGLYHPFFKSEMSFSGLKLNSPEVVGAAAIASFISFPFLKGTFEKKNIPFSVIQCANLCAFGVSFWSVTQPTRETTQRKPKAKAAAGEDPIASSNDATATTPTVPLPNKPLKPKKKKKTTVPRVRTLLPPDGWSFLIWAPIFVGETLMVGTQLALSEASPLVPIIRQVTGPYLFAKQFQILWNTSFRPEFQQGIYKYVAPLNLSGLALSLSFCHQAYTAKEARSRYGAMDFILNFLPLSLHFGWTTVTSLVNWNASIAVEKDIPTKYVAYFGHASVGVATFAGVGVTLRRGAPWYGAVIAWALAAVASGLTKRVKGAENEKERDEEFILAAERQRTASMAGSLLCLATSLIAILSRSSKKQK